MKMETKAKISVVVPVLNRAKLIERSLDSIAAQDVRPLNLYIVDNGSDDGTQDVVRNWVRRHADDKELRVTLMEDKQRGAARARQTALDIVDTEWVYFFDSDDEMLPGTLSGALALGDEADLVCFPLQLVDLNGHTFTLPIKKGNPLRRQVFNSLLSTQAYICRTKFIKDAGGWNKSLMVWDDWELGIRLLRHNPRVAFLHRNGAKIYRQAESITGTDFGSKQGQWEGVIDLIAADAGTDRRLREMMDYRRVILAAHYRREGRRDAARRLLDRTLRSTTCSPIRKWLLRLIYIYTAHGGRGAYLLWR